MTIHDVSLPSQAFHALASGATCKVSALVTFVKRGTVFAACGGMPEVLEIGIMDGLTRSSLKTGKRLEMIRNGSEVFQKKHLGLLLFFSWWVKVHGLGGLSDEVDG